MEHFDWLGIPRLCWWCIIFIGLMICPCRAPAVNTHCSTLVYGGGGSASVTCYFSEDLRPILKYYGGYVMEHKTTDDVRQHVIESYWITPDNLSHVVKDGYYFNSDGITDRLTVFIPHFADRFKGEYHCSLFPPQKGKNDDCTLDNMSPTAPVVSTARSTAAQSTQTPNTTETHSHSTSDSGLVLKIVFTVLACIIAAAAPALVVFMWRRRNRRRRFHQPTIQGSEPFLPKTGKEAVMGNY